MLHKQNSASAEASFEELDKEWKQLNKARQQLDADILAFENDCKQVAKEIDARLDALEIKEQQETTHIKQLQSEIAMLQAKLQDTAGNSKLLSPSNKYEKVHELRQQSKSLKHTVILIDDGKGNKLILTKNASNVKKFNVADKNAWEEKANSVPECVIQEFFANEKYPEIDAAMEHLESNNFQCLYEERNGKHVYSVVKLPSQKCDMVVPELEQEQEIYDYEQKFGEESTDYMTEDFNYDSVF